MHNFIEIFKSRNNIVDKRNIYAVLQLDCSTVLGPKKPSWGH